MEMKEIEKFDKACDMEYNLEISACKKVNEARNLLIDALSETRHVNRHTYMLRDIIKELEPIILTNTKEAVI